jgi:hypothetical protein
MSACGGGISEPRTYDEAMAGAHAAEWRRAMDEEMAAQLTNGTWELAVPPAGTRLLSCRWVYNVKRNPFGSEPTVTTTTTTGDASLACRLYVQGSVRPEASPALLVREARGSAGEAGLCAVGVGPRAVRQAWARRRSQGRLRKVFS